MHPICVSKKYLKKIFFNRYRFYRFSLGKGFGVEVSLSVEVLPLVSIWGSLTAIWGSLTAFESRLLDVGGFYIVSKWNKHNVDFQYYDWVVSYFNF